MHGMIVNMSMLQDPPTEWAGESGHVSGVHYGGAK